MGIGETSDGYHTFNELYAHRAALFLALCSVARQTQDVWCSKLHSDGTMFEGYFIIGINTYPGTQITYHLPLAYWKRATRVCLELEQAPAFDGHSPAEVIQRLERFFA